MLAYLKNKFILLPKRAKQTVVFLVIFLFGIGLWTVPAQAQDFGNILVEFNAKLFLALGKIFISFAIFALKFFIAIAQYNEYLDVPTVQIGWIMVRDVANMFFVVALLMIAFGTILGLENYQWNKTLIKLIFSAILINFSNLICAIFIDIAHVFTITFVSAIAGTAGGNLINMFKMQEIYKIVTGGADPAHTGGAGMDLDLVGGAFVSFIFALLAAMIMGIYAFIMAARMVALWVLIILSPLAFILQVIPQTQQYAKQWWDYFGKYVIVAPVMVFFMWLAFATMGAGDIVTTLNLKLGATELAEITRDNANVQAGGTVSEQSLSISAVSTWTNMANFFIPLIFLIIGTKIVQQLGVVGGDMLNKAVDFAKTAGAVMSGYATARWIAGKGVQGVKKVGEGAGKVALGAYMNLPFLGGRAIKRTIGRLDEFRHDNKFIKYIPIIGGYGADRNEKLDNRLKSRKEWGATRRRNELSNPENQTIGDKIGGWMAEHTGGVLGWGMKLSSKGKNDEEKRYLASEERKKNVADNRNKETRAEYMAQVKEQVEILDKNEDALLTEQVNVDVGFQEYAQANQDRDENEIRSAFVRSDDQREDYRTFVGANGDKTKEELYKKYLEELNPKSREQYDKAVEEDGGKAWRKSWEEDNQEAIHTALREKYTTENEGYQDFAKQNENRRRDPQEIRDAWLAKTEAGKAFASTFAVGQEGRVLDLAKSIGSGEVQLTGKNGKPMHIRDQQAVANTMRGAFFADKATVSEAVLKHQASEVRGGLRSTVMGRAWTNKEADAEVGAQVAEDIVKGLKNARLEEQYTKASDKMKEMLKLGGKDLSEAIKKALKGDDLYVRVLGQSQQTKLREESANIRKKQADDNAQDAFVNKIRYGTTAPSTALSDYAEVKMKEFRNLEKRAAQKKVGDTLADLMQKTARGEELDIDQQAQLFAAHNFLTESGWVDDENSYIFQQFANLRDGKLKGDDKDKWQNMAAQFKKIGLLSDKVVEDDGTMKQDDAAKTALIVEAKYKRESAAALQNLAITGGDVELVAMQHEVNQIRQANAKKAQEEKEKVIADTKLDPKNEFNTRLAEETGKIRGAYSTSHKDATPEQVEAAIAEQVQVLQEQLIAENAGGVKAKIEEATKDIDTDYWKIATQVLAKNPGKYASIVGGSGSARDSDTLKAKLKERFAKYEDFFQEATRNNLANALKIGHSELGWNQSFDDNEDSYRFIDVVEAKNEMRNERSKLKKHQLLGGDQFHTYGAVDLKHGVVIDLDEETINQSIGKVERQSELSSMPERTLMATISHKEGEAVVNRVGADGDTYGVYEAAIIKKLMADHGITDKEEQKQWLLKHQILSAVMGGKIGMAKVFGKALGNTDEDENEQQIVRVAVMDEEFRTMSDILKKILKSSEGNRNYFDGTQYEGQYESTRRRIQSQIDAFEANARTYAANRKRGGSNNARIKDDADAQERNRDAGNYDI